MRSHRSKDKLGSPDFKGSKEVKFKFIPFYYDTAVPETTTKEQKDSPGSTTRRKSTLYLKSDGMQRSSYFKIKFKLSTQAVPDGKLRLIFSYLHKLKVLNSSEDFITYLIRRLGLRSF